MKLIPEIINQRFIIVHIFLGLEKYAIGLVIIQMDVKFIEILGKFLADNLSARNGLEANMDFAMNMQKNIKQRNIIIRKSWLSWLSWMYVDFAIYMQRNIGRKKNTIGKS